MPLRGHKLVHGWFKRLPARFLKPLVLARRNGGDGNKNPAGVSRGEREHLLPSEPDKADTYGYDARTVVDRCSIVRPCEQSCPVCETEKPNSNK
jgi:hypothetical protein